MVRALSLSLILCGCTLSIEVPSFKTVDPESRQAIANLQTTLQGLAGAIDKTIDEKVDAKLAKKAVKK